MQKVGKEQKPLLSADLVVTHISSRPDVPSRTQFSLIFLLFLIHLIFLTAGLDHQQQHQAHYPCLTPGHRDSSFFMGNSIPTRSSFYRPLHNHTSEGPMSCPDTKILQFSPTTLMWLVTVSLLLKFPSPYLYSPSFSHIHVNSYSYTSSLILIILVMELFFWLNSDVSLYDRLRMAVHVTTPKRRAHEYMYVIYHVAFFIPRPTTTSKNRALRLIVPICSVAYLSWFPFIWHIFQ